jgi:hypothetical protein
MIMTRWIVRCDTCGYLLRPEYPAQWMPDIGNSYRFRHKREALRVVAEYSRNVREHMFVEPVHSEKDVIFD